MIGKGHYPYQASIDFYGNGGFRFADMSHKGSVLCLPSGMHAWPVISPADLCLEVFEPVFEVADRIDVLFVGMGAAIAAIDPHLRASLKDRHIIVESVSTFNAISTYNILLAEHRAVGAALIAVDRE